jgi:hypothetical protein
MKREHIVVMAAAVGLSFGSGVVGVAVGAGAAQAMPTHPARISSIRKGCAPTRPAPISGAPACRCHAAPTAPVTRSIPTGT